ncbi:MAG: anaerobic ribonucleoside-triphosphate reductase activating protein [Clostridia bacterium]|nr:anaerobic ribonucleoside-triphosphate reductase activating protein [Clostridia bacterium]
MNYGAIKKTDIANGPGVRVSLFISGCRNHCPGCFQPETWDFDYGEPFTKKTEDEIIEALNHSWIQGLSILGGDPMEPENQERLLPFLRRVKETLPEKDIWLYTGYTLEDIATSPLLSYADVVVDGPFVEAEKDLSLAFRGSRNQRIIYLRSEKNAGRQNH